MSVHVLFVIYSLGPGGAERVVSSLLSNHAQRGDQVDLVTMDAVDRDGLFYDLDPGVRLHAIGFARPAGNIFLALWNNLNRTYRLRKLIRRIDPQIVISHLVETNIVTLLALAGTNYPVIVTEHTDPYTYQLGRLWMLLRKILYPLAAKVVVLNKHAASYFGCSLARRVAVIPNPVQDQFYKIERSENPVQDERVIFLGVGRLDQAKRFEVMVEAFAEVYRELPNCSLVIAGDGPRRATLEHRCGELGILGAVKFVGQVSDIARLYQSASVFLSTSTLEGFPVAMSEAMVSGLPVIATKYGPGIQDLITDGVNGIIVARDDHSSLVAAMLHLARDSNARAGLGNNARKLYDQVCIKTVLRQWDGVYMSVLGAHG